MPSPFDVIVCGSLHLDAMVYAPTLPRPDETVAGSRWSLECGGKGGNQAVMAVRAGARAAMIGCVGADDFGVRLRGSLTAAGVDASAVHVDEAAASGMSAAIVRDDGGYGAVIVSGANLRIDLAAIRDDWGALGGASILVLQNEITEAANIAAAHVVMNAAPARTMSRELLDLVEILIVNRIEATMLTGRDVRDPTSALSALSSLGSDDRDVIVTLGGEGLVVRPRGLEASAIAPIPVPVTSTHGAGGLLCRRARSGDRERRAPARRRTFRQRKCGCARISPTVKSCRGRCRKLVRHRSTRLASQRSAARRPSLGLFPEPRSGAGPADEASGFFRSRPPGSRLRNPQAASTPKRRYITLGLAGSGVRRYLAGGWRMASVDVVNAHKSYGSVEVIHGVSISIADGEFVTLVGPSGCGKSTLLRMIAGLESISDGRIKIGARVVNNLPPKDRDIAMVFQNYALYPHKTVAENMSFGLKLRHTPKAEIAARVQRAAEILDISPYLSRYPRQLSGGQRQRVAMGRAIVRDPQVFLFDEPLSNLDAKLRVQMRAEIKELHQRLGTTTIYVTHDQIEAMTMADRIVVMRDGVVEQVGMPLDLYDRPNTLFVAGFIGSPAMNLLKGAIRINGKPSFVTEAGVELPLKSAPSGMDGRLCVYGIRPEHLALGGGEVKVEVSVVEPTGSETQVVAMLGGQKIVGVFRERVSARPGEILSLSPNLASVHLFDAQNGTRLD